MDRLILAQLLVFAKYISCEQNSAKKVLQKRQSLGHKYIGYDQNSAKKVLQKRQNLGHGKFVLS